MNSYKMAAQAEKADTEIKRLRGLNDTLEKELEKLRGEMESSHTRRKVETPTNNCTYSCLHVRVSVCPLAHVYQSAYSCVHAHRHIRLHMD